MPNNFFPSVSIVLLNYNGFEDTIACLKSIKDISYENYNIVIVDNASTDDSCEKLESYLKINVASYSKFHSPKEAMENNVNHEKYTLILSNYNGGYGYGNNIGIKYALNNAENDYFLLINNDTIVESNFLEPMVEVCEADKDIGIASGKIYFHDRPDVIWFNGGKLQSCTAKINHINYEEKDIGQITPYENTFITGCLWLLPKNIIHDVGLINEKYFMYVEDLEYCQRVLNSGYKLTVCKKSIIWHKVGGSGGGELSAFSAYWMARNKVKFIMQYSNKYCKVIALSYLVFYDSLRWLRRKNMALLFSHLKGMLDWNK